MNREKKERMKRNEDRDLWDNIKDINICNRGFPEGEREKGSENIFADIRDKNLPNWGRKQSPKSRKLRESHTG